MKANEAPEKLYILFNRPHNVDYTKLNKRRYEEEVEYTRTDAFIEKALKWYCLDCECNGNCNADYKCFFRQEYKRYLEGNNNAIPPKFDNAINPDGSLTENYRYRHFIRKVRDTFIEKAWGWIEDNMLSSNQQDRALLYYRQFINYMEGE